MLNFDMINGYLRAMENLNLGSDHGCDYFIQQLAGANNTLQVVENYFGSIVDGQGKQHPPQSWHIELTALSVADLQTIISDWFLHTTYSPTPHSSNKNRVVDGFINLFDSISLSRSHIYKVLTKPPIWYDAVWDDVVIVAEQQHFLLHFGVSD